MKKNILVVDDDFDSRNILKKYLEKENYGVELARNDSEAFRALAAREVHLVLLDLKLTDTSGFEICKKAREDSKYSDVPIIAISVSQLEEDIVKAIECGANDFIAKPFNYRILLAKIVSLLTLKEEKAHLRKNREKLIELIKSTSNQKNVLSQEAEFSRDLNQFLDADLKKAFIKEKLSGFLGIRLFTIFTIDENEREFRLFVSNHPDIPQNFIVPIDRESIMYEVLKTKNYLFLKDYRGSRFKVTDREKYTSEIVCAVPLISGDRTIGVLNVNDPEFDNNENYDFEGRIVRISRHLAVSIHNTILYEKVKDLSMRDSMTGLYNFRHFLETLKIEVERAVRYKEPLACIMLDIDNFKSINDSYGHQVGDLVLKELARSVSLSVRSSDIPARYGGDEFIIVLPNTGKEFAMKISQRLMKLFSGKPIRVPSESKMVNVTLSIGIAGLPDDTLNMDKLMKLTDEALYRAKREGKNRIVMK